MTENTDLEVTIADVDQTLTELDGWKDGFAAARNEDEPYILLRAVNLLGDYLTLLRKEQDGEQHHR
jgi:hypothetical protein